MGKFKLNWGHSIFIVIMLFLIASFWVIGLSFKQKINLVTEDYYPKELEYQEVINKKKNAEKYNKKVTVMQTGNELLFTFPDSLIPAKVAGEIYFYRPSDYEKDVRIPISPNDSLQQVFTTANLLKGRYNVIIDWKYEEMEYYQESSLNIR